MSTSINKEDLILMGGLPRSGNTLLSALLNQNDSIFVTTTSPFVELLFRNSTLWDDEEYKPETGIASVSKLKSVVLKAVQESYHSGLTDREYVIDKKRQWNKVFNIEMYIETYGHKPKILCPVRNVTEILSSYNSLFKNNNITLDIKKDLSGNAFLGSYLQLREAYYSEYKDCFHFIEFDDLLQDTQNTLDKVYDYLGIERFTHDLNNIKALEEEGDYGIAGLHTLKPKLEPNNSRKDTEEAFEKFVGWEFWR